MAEIRDYNTSPDPQTSPRWPENMAMSAVNDTGRIDEGIIARWEKDVNTSLVSTGTATAYVITPNRDLVTGQVTPLYDGLTIGFTAHIANGADPTLNVQATGAKQIVDDDGGNIGVGQIAQNSKVVVYYSSAKDAYVVASPVKTSNFAGAATGTGNAVVLTPDKPVTSYTDGLEIIWRATATNTGAVTVNVSGLGAKAIEKLGEPLVSDDITTDDTVEMAFNTTRDAFQMLSPARVIALPRGYVDGLQVQSVTPPDDVDHDFTMYEGECRDQADAVNIELASPTVKQIDASWAAGTNQGGLSSSLTLTANTTYYVFAIVVAGASDVGVDSDPDAANLITDHSATAYRMRAKIRTDASANIERIDHFGSVVQTVHFETGEPATGTNTIPFDDTIPQNTEGDQYMVARITPTNANNNLLIDVVFHAANTASAGNWFMVALFKDTDADAIAVGCETNGGNYGLNISFRKKIRAELKTEIEFKVRAGSQGVGTTTFNGQGSTGRFGGTMASSITITEMSG